MKINLRNIKSIILLLLFICILIPFITSWRDNPPNYTTGAPGEFTCNVCHTADPNHPQNGTLELSGLPDTILPEQTYRVKVKLTLTEGQANYGGFQLTVIGKDLRQFGVLSNPSTGSALAQQLFRQYFEHSGANIFNNNVLEWEADWTAPIQTVKSQEIKFYLTALLGNNDSSAFGDQSLKTVKAFYFKSSYKELNMTITSKDASCAGVNDGSATAFPVDGIAPYQFIWSNGSTNASVDSLKAGSYRVSIIDAGSDTLSKVVTISEPNPVFGRIIKTDIPCNANVSAEAIVIPSTGISPFTYSWSNGDTGTVTRFDTPGKISVTITDANGCSYIANSFILNQDTFKLTTTNITNVRCNGGNSGSATVQANIPFITSYAWSDGQQGATATDLSAGEYTVTATSPAGCEVISTVLVREPAKINVKTNSSINPSCAGGYNGVLSVFADGGVPPYSYLWEDGSTDKTRLNLIAGTYTVTVTDAFDCSVAQQFMISDPDTLHVLVQGVKETGKEANDGQAAALVSGGNQPYTYYWSNGKTSQTVDHLNPGYYEVTVTDLKGCKVEKSIYISPFECNLLISNVEKTNIACYGDKTGFISIEASGGTVPYSYRWSTGAKNPFIAGVTGGNYSLEVKDSTGCAANAFFVVNSAPKLVKNITILDATSQFSSDGQIKFSLAGGTVPFTIEVDGIDTITTYNGIATFKNLFNGLHSYSITDGNGCRTSDFFVINILGCQLNIDSISLKDIRCFGETNGEICIFPGNATGNVSIHWDDETTAACRKDLSAGSYSVHIEDGAGCQFLDTFTVSQPQALKVSLLTIDTPTVGKHDGSIRLVISGGTNPIDIVWTKNGVLFDEDINQIEEGTYYYIATDANGCQLEGDTIKLIGKTSGLKYAALNTVPIFPNPALSEFFIPININNQARCELIDLQGNRIIIEPQRQNEYTKFEINNLANGVYILQINEGQLIYRGKLSILK